MLLSLPDMPGLDYLSCILTVLATVLIGKRRWQGWVIAGANSVVVCIIGARTAQFGFIPANVLCIALYANNLWSWRGRAQESSSAKGVPVETISQASKLDLI